MFFCIGLLEVLWPSRSLVLLLIQIVNQIIWPSVCFVSDRGTYFVRSKLLASHMADNLLSKEKKRKK